MSCSLQSPCDTELRIYSGQKNAIRLSMENSPGFCLVEEAKSVCPPHHTLWETRSTSGLPHRKQFLRAVGSNVFPEGASPTNRDIDLGYPRTTSFSVVHAPLTKRILSCSLSQCGHSQARLVRSLPPVRSHRRPWYLVWPLS